MNFPEVAQGADEIARFHFRSFDIVPACDGVLVKRLRHAVTPPALHKSGNDLDVEDPSRQKWCREHFKGVRRRPEELGAALRVIDRKAEARGDEGRADAAEVVTRCLA